MATNLHAYSYYKVDALTFLFTTVDGDEYNCFFLSYSEYFKSNPSIASNFFSFNLKLISGVPKRKGVDPGIADTVITIVGDFLNSKINAVIYVCDNSDGKEAVRARNFLSWFRYYDHPSHKIIKVSGDFDAGGITLYTALLVHKGNKLKNELIQAYLELIDSDEEEK